jgi:formate hydrogenlyase subunit 3/multisubunit Na+/H+ antiporter MnhD subunit
MAVSSPLGLILCGAVTIAASGFLALTVRRGNPFADRIATITHLAGALLAAFGLWRGWSSPDEPSGRLPWGLPFGSGRIALDGLSSAFLIPVLLVPAMGAWFGLAYWSGVERPESFRRLRIWFGLLAASLVVLLIARDGLLFLLAWEGMALAAFFLVATEHELRTVRVAAWTYFVATHLGTMALLAMLAILGSSTGSFELTPVGPAAIGQGTKLAILLLAVLGFGMKAGVMPLHVWLPPAHAAAPSHVSAVLSGVVIKTGIYGLARITSMLPDPPIVAGGLLLVLGVASGILGVLYAIGQHDLKRLLAYHSIENIGIIVIGLGLAELGRSLGRAEWVVLGLGGAILHVWNHALFKSLLFLAAGSVVRATRSREIDRLGGIAQRMPWTAACFLIGAVAICGLPPLNGFVSEFLVYLGLLCTVRAGELAALVAGAGVPALALIGALAVACFVKVYGAVFLGQPRSPLGLRVREAPAAMCAPMALLAAACLLIGLAPAAFLGILDRANASWAGTGGLPGSSAATLPELRALLPAGAISILGASIVVLGTAAFLVLRRRMGRTPRVLTWDCGYTAPSARMQYTSSSTAHELIRVSSWVLRPRERVHADTGWFPSRWRYSSRVVDVVLDLWIVPVWRRFERFVLWCRVLQQGRIQIYLFYVLLALAVAILSAAPLLRWLREFLAS